MLNKHFLNRTNRLQQAGLLIVVLIVGALGTYFLTGSHAASPYASISADSGTLTSGATEQACSGAADGNCVAFGGQTTTGGGGNTNYTLPPTKQSDGAPDQWYWEISPNNPGLNGLPATSAAYPAPGAANIWDTDLFQDAGTSVSSVGIPTGPSPVVTAIHAAGHYSICYVEAGAQQTGFPDFNDFATADYINGSSSTTQMQGYANENWFDIRGFANYVAGNSGTLTGAAPNIAAGLNARFAGCKAEGQNAVEPDDLDGYTNKSQSKAAGGGWGLTEADAAGFERWLSYDIHANGLAAFLKNDDGNGETGTPSQSVAANAKLFDGVVIEECNFYTEPCSTWQPFLSAGKPVLNAEYADQDGMTTAKFCSADEALGITGSLFNVNLDGTGYVPCEN